MEHLSGGREDLTPENLIAAKDEFLANVAALEATLSALHSAPGPEGRRQIQKGFMEMIFDTPAGAPLYMFPKAGSQIAYSSLLDRREQVAAGDDLRFFDASNPLPVRRIKVSLSADGGTHYHFETVPNNGFVFELVLSENLQDYDLVAEPLIFPPWADE